MKIKYTLPLFLAIIALFVSANAQIPKPTPTEAEKAKTKQAIKDYEDALAKVKKSDYSIDFAKFRLDYTETEDYSPYGGSAERSAMIKALNEDNYKDALSKAQDMLKTNYIDLHSHYTASIAYKMEKKDKEAAHHKEMFDRLMKAITKNDGLSAKTAMISLGISEQYFIMNFYGFPRGAKTLERHDNSIFDVHSVQNPETKESRKFYFNIDKVFGRMF